MRSKFLTDALGYHLHEARNAFEDAPSMKEGNHPAGALIVAACAVRRLLPLILSLKQLLSQAERSLKLWSSGTYNKQQEQTKFSADNVGDRMKVFCDLVSGLERPHWILILQEASDVACRLSNNAQAVDEDLSDATNADEPEEAYDPVNLADEDEDSDLEALRNQ